jgi:hypothetical protein
LVDFGEIILLTSERHISVEPKCLFVHMFGTQNQEIFIKFI